MIISILRKRVKSNILATLPVTEKLKPKSAGGGVLLSFDDGPHPNVTQAVLDRLAAFRARAAFFVVGNRISKAASVLAIIKAEGHMIGNHTFSHNSEMSYSAYVEDIKRCQSLVYDSIQQFPTTFRPPGGRITIPALRAARSLKLRPVLWTVDRADWAVRDRASARVVGQKMVEDTTTGDILLLHDDNPFVLDVLDVLLPMLAERGMELGRGPEQFQR